MPTLTKVRGAAGLPTWSVHEDGVLLGHVTDTRPNPREGMRWFGTAPDGRRFWARSRPKLLQLLAIHHAFVKAASSDPPIG